MAAGVRGFIGFAVGRATWLAAVTAWHQQAITREIAVARLAPLLGKQPPDFHVWVGGEVPAFVKSEQPLYPSAASRARDRSARAYAIARK